ncbi:MAG: acetyltransferase [Bacteroidetes bacterium HGW-Bacteroidetes-21]|jgi:sugar O-acyltransferase (sialic acid O-acetyltransferase NeuD family)|nr:MAG: acetyltransferase [Bacteroidetes bacterium HGW-Bacteroidetes-21]
MNKKSIILVGGGGHCLSAIDVILATEEYEITGIVDKPEKLGDNIMGYKYIATDNELPELVAQNHSFLVTVGQLTNNDLRVHLFNLLKSLHARMATIISPLAYVSAFSKIGLGTLVMHKSLINAGTVIGENNIINTMALVEHNCVVGNHCHISTGTVINGDVVVEDNCFIGSRTVIRNGLLIRQNTITGAGAVVVKDTESNAVYMGNPARKKI